MKHRTKRALRKKRARLCKKFLGMHWRYSAIAHHMFGKSAMTLASSYRVNSRRGNDKVAKLAWEFFRSTITEWYP